MLVQQKIETIDAAYDVCACIYVCVWVGGWGGQWVVVVCPKPMRYLDVGLLVVQ